MYLCIEEIEQITEGGSYIRSTPTSKKSEKESDYIEVVDLVTDRMFCTSYS